MILQNVIYPSFDTCTEEQMYFRRNSEVEYYWFSDELNLRKNAFVSFDTYFNSLTLDKWKKYTIVKDLALMIEGKGSFIVTLMRKKRESNGEVITEYLGEKSCDSEEIKKYRIEFNSIADSGSLCFQIITQNGNASIYSAAYISESIDNKITDIKIGIDICTYKREEFIEHNLRVLNKHFIENTTSLLYKKLEIFIIDNAHSLDKNQLKSKAIHIYDNKNVGGAGGFTRGMIEIKKNKSITHILVMDDDIKIEPESIYRTFVMLSLLRDEYKDSFIGGAMLKMDIPFMQIESGGKWNRGEIISLKGGLDLRNFEACLYNEFEEAPQYNAWWYCSFPTDIIKNDNLPIPIFIRGDDVEYGLRNMKHLILMNGICVWHESFENKYSSFIYYYILRNRLINNAIHNVHMSSQEIKKLLYQWVMDEIRIYRYKNANLIMRGVEDFFKGVEWLEKQDGEELHQSIITDGYKLQFLDDIEEDVQFLYPLYTESINNIPVTGFIHRIINHFTINGHYLPTKNKYKIVPILGVQQISVYRTKTILNYDYASRKGFVTIRNLESARNCIKRLKKLYKVIDREYEITVKSYEDNAQKLMNINFWEKYLGRS